MTPSLLVVTNDGAYFLIATILTFFIAVVIVELLRRAHMRYLIKRDRLHRDEYRIKELKDKEK